MNLKDLNHLRQDKRIRFSEEVVNGETLTIVSYMVADPTLWKLPLAEECRGIVFNSSGKCISRPFHKFFNTGENEDNQVYHLKGKQFEILEKRDGSMLTPVLVNGEIFWKTKKSFYSDVAVEAAKNVPENVNRFARYCINVGLTLIFEYTSQLNKVVINYSDTPEFVLLAVRDNSHGGYWPYEDMCEVAAICNIKVIQKFDKTLEQCLSEVDTLINFEGWCLRDTSTGFYCKLKTAWYLRNHRAQTELRERDVADMIIDETIDDIKSALALDGFDITPIEEIEKRVADQITELSSSVIEIVKSIADKTNFKQIAADYKDHKLFGLIMSEVRGKTPNYKKYWANNMRDRYSLKAVYNSNF